MKRSRLYMVASIPILVLMQLALINNQSWLLNSAEIITYLILIPGFMRRLDFSNFNLLAFLGLNMAAVLFKTFQEVFLIYYVIMLFKSVSYIFLIREAIRHTTRKSANRYMLIFFFLMIGANTYYAHTHFQEFESQLSSWMEFAFYSLYYLVLLVLSVVSLIYYLNSYSRKSVFHIVLVMSIVVADMLRDMAYFYLPDTSVLLLQTLLNFAGILLAFQFFATKEKKLKLINLV
ncbi:hypothetical protein [Christiangramia sabulilitoris]|uniref:Uncharacterized protein n=1 Tax=Christiangramia sabulilitoris TaxID=2583991 RepID=A0A550I7R4_9FLAO|nr:hypothetical protein [Christiangramia sabulilitoris]TRO67007.1 hypothetical protein FGM01_03715 [Christiangramia sabulilitoris]